MSAFIVSHETINACVNAMQGDRQISCEQLDEIGRNLWNLNNEALFARYGEREDLELFTYRVTFTYTAIEKIKALTCLIYQCSEGNIPEVSTLYAEMVKRRNDLAMEFINDLPEYLAADWNLKPRRAGSRV